MINIVECNDIIEQIKGLISTLNALKTKKVLVCGRPELIDDFKSLVEGAEAAKMFSEYEFYYYSDNKFEEGEQVYLIPCEERTKPLFVYLSDEEKEEEK